MAKPTAIGNATAIPAISVAATMNKFERLKTTPPSKAEPKAADSACSQIIDKTTSIFTHTAQSQSEQ